MAFYLEPDPDGEPEASLCQEASVSGQWVENCGGCLNVATWRQNAQFVLELGPPTAGHLPSSQSQLEIKLARANVPFKVSIGLYIVPLRKDDSLPMLSLEEAMVSNSLQKAPFVTSNLTTSEFWLSEGKYVLIPCTYEVWQGEEPLDFTLAVKSSTSSVTLRPAPPLDFSLRCTGTWIPPALVTIPAQSRFSFSSDEDALVRVWLVASNRMQNPEPLLHLWKFKLLESLTFSRFNGELSTEFHVAANTPYYLIATPTSPETPLSSFHMFITSDYPLEFADTNIDRVPALCNPSDFTPKGPPTPKKEVRTSSRTNSGDVPIPLARSDPKTTAICFSGTFDPNKPIANSHSHVKQASFNQFVPPAQPQAPSIISPTQEVSPSPPPTDPFNLTGIPIKPAFGKQSATPPSPSTSPMARGRLIESDFNGCVDFSNQGNNGSSGPHSPSETPLSQSESPTPSSVITHSSGSAGSDSSALNVDTPQLQRELAGKLDLDAAKMDRLPRPPSVMLSTPPAGVVSSISSMDSHRIQFSLDSSSTALARNSSPPDLSKMLAQDGECTNIRFSWTQETAGGNARHITWRNNEQWLLEVTKPSDFIFLIAQLGHRPPVSVGVYVLKASTHGPLRRIQIDDEEQKIIFDDSPTSSFTMALPIGRYVIIPCTELPGIEREAVLSIKSSEKGEYSVQTLTDSWTSTCADGEWNESTSGGCWTERTWIKNTQYQLTFKRKTFATICLSVEQQPPSPIGFYVVHNQNPRFKTVLEMTPETLLFPVQFRQRNEIVKTIQAGSDGEVFNIIPATFLAHSSVHHYKLTVYTAEPGLVSLENITKYTDKFTHEGKWLLGAPGGCLDHSSWRHNPQLKVSFPWIGHEMQVGFVLTQWPRSPEEDEEDASTDSKPSTQPPSSGSKTGPSTSTAASPPLARNLGGTESGASSACSSPRKGTSTSGTVSIKSSKSSISVPLNSIVTSTPLEYGADEEVDHYEPFGFYVYPVEDAKVKRVVLERHDLLMPAAMATAKRVSGSFMLTHALLSKVDKSMAELIVSPFAVNQYVEKATNYELLIVIQSSDGEYNGNKCLTVPPSISAIPNPRANISHRSEWTDPLSVSLAEGSTASEEILSSISSPQNAKHLPKELSSVEGTKLCRAVVRRFQILEPNTFLVILLIQKAFCLGQIQVYKISPTSPALGNAANHAQNTSPKVALEKNQEDAMMLLTRSKLVHSSKISRSKENTLECTIAEPGFYAIAAVPEAPESVGPLLLIVHYWKMIKDLNVDTTSSGEKQVKRAQVIGEILSTETSYVKNLKVLVQHFMSSLIARSVELGVDVEDVKKIFSNIPTLLNCNTAFLDQLKATAASGENAIGRVFGDFCNFFLMYAEYTNHFDSNCRLLEELKKKSSFKEALQALENSPLALRLHFRDFYITPVQRIPRYALLLEQLLRYTDSSHPDYLNLVQSYDRVKNVAFDINEKKRRADAEALVVSIQSTVFYKKSKENPLIAIPARLFMRSSSCRVLGVGPGDAPSPPQSSPGLSKKSNKSFSPSSSSSMTGGSNSNGNPLVNVPSLEQAVEADYIFLFNDCIILTHAKRSRKKFIWKHQIALTSDSDVSTYKDTVLCLRTPVTSSVTVTYFFEFHTTQFRDLWMSELSVLIQLLVNQMHHKLSSKVAANCKVLDSKMQMLLPS